MKDRHGNDDGKPGCAEGLALTLLWCACGFLLRPWVLTKLWFWFVVSTFEVKPISLPLALGLSALANTVIVIRPAPQKEDMTRMQRWTDAIAWSVVLPLCALCFGAIYHTLM